MKKGLLRRLQSFKVTDVGTNRKPACDLLTYILSRTVSEYRRLLFKFWTLCVFEPLWGLGATYTIHLRFIGPPVVDYLFVLIELFSLGVTADALQANIDWKLAFLERVGQFRPNFLVVERLLANHFCTDR